MDEGSGGWAWSGGRNGAELDEDAGTGAPHDQFGWRAGEDRIEQRRILHEADASGDGEWVAGSAKPESDAEVRELEGKEDIALLRSEDGLDLRGSGSKLL